MTLRLSDGPQLPFNYTEYGVQLTSFLQETYTLLDQYGGNNYVELAAVRNAIVDFANAANSYADTVDNFLAERLFLGPGLPKRPWYRHVIQAPGMMCCCVVL